MVLNVLRMGLGFYALPLQAWRMRGVSRRRSNTILREVVCYSLVQMLTNLGDRNVPVQVQFQFWSCPVQIPVNDRIGLMFRRGWPW